MEFRERECRRGRGVGEERTQGEDCRTGESGGEGNTARSVGREGEYLRWVTETHAHDAMHDAVCMWRSSNALEKACWEMQG